jgi:hypothetical protein
MDEVSIQVNPIYSNTLGGAKLQVWEHNVEEALLLLAQNDLTSVEDATGLLEERDIEAKANEGTEWISYRNIGFVLLLFVILVVFLKAFGVV